jgi:anti-anti-sigma regulatory factor/anti-sigma regulatory factor (Ser/Thr protein kinase)
LYDGGSTGVDRAPDDPRRRTWQVDREGPVTRLTPRGPLDDGSAPALRDGLLRCLAEYPAAVIVDLSVLRVGDESALASIVSEGVGLPPVPVLLAGAGDDLARRLERLDIAPLYPTPEAARAAATTPAALADRFAASLSADRSAPAQGRVVVERACLSWRLTHLVPAASLVVSELCANAVTHGRPPLRLVVARIRTGLHLVVRDGSPQPALLRPRRADGQPTQSGNGMHLVAAFVGTWGTWPTVDGKAVWATIPIGAG